MSYLKSRFPGLYARIEATRATDPALAEICDDLEALARIYKETEATMDSEAKQNMMDSIRGLENEISAVFELHD